MGRIQSSVGLITGTDIVGTVDQLIAISAQPRDRLVASTELLANKQAAIAELTASVIGVQLAGNRLSSSTLFKSKTSTSSNSDALSVKSGSAAQVGTHVVRTLQTASTHNTTSLQRFSASDTALGFTGQISINHGENLIDDSVALSSLNNGRGVEAGVVRITDRSGKSAEIDFSSARDMDDVISLIND
uniref:flagellar cap protein FliD N-terminal domain-containing protein n=1 Tax=Novipirellula sp. TaxID=2795430 RepID=UPI00356576FF